MSIAAESFRNRVRNCGSFGNKAHRDADSGKAVGHIVVHNEFSKAPIGEDGVCGLVVVTSHRQRLTKTANAVATHFGAAAIGIPKLHYDIDVFAIGTSRTGGGARPNDETVGTDTPTTVAKSAGQGGITMKRSVDFLKSDNEIVA
jgi:hypothetical protein